jgi:hypothetical protein
VTTIDDEGSHYGGYPNYPTSSSYTYIGSQKARQLFDKTNGFQKEDG